MPTSKSTLFLFAAAGLLLLGGCTAVPAAGEGCKAAGTGAVESLDRLPSPLQVDGKWETNSGQTIHLSDLKGKPRIIAMFFTTCEGTCVLTVDYLRQIEASLPASTRSEVGFVLVTLDPIHDTPAALEAYRRSRSLSSDRWILLRGGEAQTAGLSRRLNVTFNRASSRGFVHSSGVTVLDCDGKVVHQQLGLHPDLQSVLAAVNALAAKPLRAAEIPGN